MIDLTMVTTDKDSFLFTDEVGLEMKLDELEKSNKAYQVWDFNYEYEPKKDVTCVFNFNDECFSLSDELTIGKTTYKKGKHSLKGCKDINAVYDRLSDAVSDMETVGHRFIEGECLDGLLDE